MFLLRATS
ncbi:rCG46501 [Rattus norvegicus]|uniref:RCG46501 n=1 Tax=Rattus norvegicus TaxID=10116 RepID=A6IC85_RAT|nr:rCG46501 [Rattus norvegicus]